MAKTKEQKKEIIKTLSEKIKQANSIVFTRFNALGVKDNEELRKELKKENSEYYVVKKTLLELAFKDFKIKNLKIKDFTGRIATVFGYGDEVMPAKIVDKFKKDKQEKIEFAGGILVDKFIEAEKIEELAKLPSKRELYAKVAGSINAPLSGFVNVLAGNLKSILNVLNSIKEKKTS